MTFHGWVDIQIDDRDDAECSVLEHRLKEAIEKLSKKVSETSDSFCHFQVAKAGNDINFLTVHGNRNHSFQPVIDLFYWVADNLKHSYGLLYVWDDEHPEYHNQYIVYRVALGKCEELPDTYLSPCIPTIEEHYL